MLEKTHII